MADASAKLTRMLAFGLAAEVYTGVGWRGTGHKSALWVGKVLAQLAVQHGTVYDIGRFTPARFAGGAVGEPLAGGVAS
jgi:hypothetical protein